MQREHGILQRKSRLTKKKIDREYFSEFSNKLKHNRAIPSTTYLIFIHNKYHYSMRAYLLKELKKLSEKNLYWDVSHKKAKRLIHCNDVPIFKGLSTATN